MSHPAPPAAESSFQRGMEGLLLGQRCCGFNYWGLGWKEVQGTGLSHAGRALASSVGWEWWRGRCHPPSLRLDQPFPLQLVELFHIEEQNTAETREHRPDRGQGDTEMGSVPSHSPAWASGGPSVLGQGRFSLPFPSPRIQQPPLAQLWLSEGWILSAAGQSVGGGCRSRLGNTKQ